MNEMKMDKVNANRLLFVPIILHVSFLVIYPRDGHHEVYQIQMKRTQDTIRLRFTIFLLQAVWYQTPSKA